ncbi:MAG: hypothetical protein Q8Q62_09020 [Mesorhizobium sp.]|nr:hypothetical protein [Mesorhizobium sp.]
MARNDIPPGLVKWAYGEKWREALDLVLDDHFLPVCDEFDLEEDRLHEILGEAASAALWTCAFEDFVTKVGEDGETTIIDDYLKRRGWKESASVRRYLEALKGSVMSLYEVGEVMPADSFLARDLILGGEPVRVHDAGMSRVLRPGNTIAMRVLEVSGRNRMSAGALLFDDQAAAALREEIAVELDAMATAMRAAEAGAKPEELEALGASGLSTEDMLKTTFLIEAAPMFSFAWMEHFLDKVPDEERTRPAEAPEREQPRHPRGARDWE